jgi:hypothetical protein
VCQQCGLDCRALVQALQVIPRGSREWQSRRRQVVQRMAPHMISDKRAAGLVERLMTQVGGEGRGFLSWAKFSLLSGFRTSACALLVLQAGEWRESGGW